MINNFFAIGFRPLYLFGALYAAISVAFWGLYYTGLLDVEITLDPHDLHMHEMIFGFGAMIFGGFILTAVRNWTGVRTLYGWGLAGLLFVWLLARILLIIMPTIGAIFDVSFFVILLISISYPIIKSGNLRNSVFIVIAAILLILDIFINLAMLEIITTEIISQLNLIAIGAFTLMITVVGGRVIPIFSRKAAGAVPNIIKSVELSVIFFTISIIIMDILAIFIEIPSYFMGALLIVTAILHLIRMKSWNISASFKTPLLWCLPLGYGWLIVGFTLRAIAIFNDNNDFFIASIHAFTIGAIAGIMVAMMTRSSKGHSGNPLIASRVDIFIYIAIFIAATVRVFVPLINSEMILMSVHLSSSLWILAFSLFVIFYIKMFFSPKR